MDKQRNERISIRINGKERIYLSDEELNQEISAAKDEDDEQLKEERKNFQPIIVEEIGAKDSVIDNIIDFEELRTGKLKGSDKIFTSKKKPFVDNKHTYLTKKKKKQHRIFGGKKSPEQVVLLKFALVLLSAITIGVGLGYIIMALFSDISDSQAVEGTALGVAAGAGSGQAALQNGVNNGAAGAGETSITNGSAPIIGIPPLKMEVIQGGAFGSFDSANEIAVNLQKSGTAAVVMPSSKPVLMFIGLGNDRSEADIIGDQYLKNGQEVYLKPFELSGIAAEKVGKPEVAQFASTGLDLYQSMASLSTQAFQNNNIKKDIWNDIKKKYSEWNKTKPKQLPTSLNQFSNSVSKAYRSLASYQAKSDEGQLWKSQQALLEGLLSYKKWHDEMK
ncbi:hypothetical protein ACNQFZ_16135 [Schinkia sp. CFF1]